MPTSHPSYDFPGVFVQSPWNHVLTYVALYLAVRVWRQTPHPPHHEPLRPLLWLVAVCVTWFWACQGVWFLAEATVLR